MYCIVVQYSTIMHYHTVLYTISILNFNRGLLLLGMWTAVQHLKTSNNFQVMLSIPYSTLEQRKSPF